MKGCGECLQWGAHAAGCPNAPKPPLTVCADCSTESEEVDRCFGDEAPEGADCKTSKHGLHYCHDCYERRHLVHEDSAQGESARQSRAMFYGEAVLVDTSVISNLTARLQHMEACVQHVSKQRDELKDQLERRSLWKTVLRWFWPGKSKS